jgi:hypothetical protein
MRRLCRREVHKGEELSKHWTFLKNPKKSEVLRQSKKKNQPALVLTPDLEKSTTAL